LLGADVQFFCATRVRLQTYGFDNRPDTTVIAKTSRYSTSTFIFLENANAAIGISSAITSNVIIGLLNMLLFL